MLKERKENASTKNMKGKEGKEREGKYREKEKEKENKWLFSKNKLSLIKRKWIKFKDERNDASFKNILIN